MIVAVAVLRLPLISGCGELCPEEDNKANTLEVAVDYPHSEDDRFTLPLDAWTKNPIVERFMRDAIAAGGISFLKTQSNLQCIPTRPTDCTDCFVCDGTVQKRAQYIGIVSRCLDWGQVLVHATIGPGSTVNAVTYWRTSPDLRRWLSRSK
jgi:hypothetical protein